MPRWLHYIQREIGAPDRGKRARGGARINLEEGEAMKRLLIASLVLAGIASSAQAQVGPQGALNNAGQIGQHAAAANAKGTEDNTKIKANDKAYNAALRNLPDKQYDPWRGVR